ncbi:MAG: YojF family protein [Symbiobacterium sp.]|jgi:Protein of unknown function (DUF1806).|uniref:YojF family protein n=1 Tax=Symbiobacterium sp. TaxID=1971213 RepID=UPI0034648188
MKPIDRAAVQEKLQAFVDRDVYIHLETTNGAYAAESAGVNSMAVCAFIRNARIRFSRALITGNGPYRVGLQMKENRGWTYAEGLTDYEIDEEGRLLLAGHDAEGRLAIALELSHTPFPG